MSLTTFCKSISIKSLAELCQTMVIDYKLGVCNNIPRQKSQAASMGKEI